MQVSVLVDNHAKNGLLVEHGLALLIETENKRILFDTGQGNALLFNAKTMGADVSSADTLILSHGHYDHTGGIAQALQACDNSIDFYCHPKLVQSRYSIRGGVARPVNVPQLSIEALDNLPPHHFHWVQSPLLLTERIGITGPIPRETSFEDRGGPFYLDAKGQEIDSIEDEVALWIKTNLGLVIFTGCAHAGLINTVRYVQHLNEGQRIRAIIGGFHLHEASCERLERSIAELISLKIGTIIPLHCTGAHAIAVLQQAMSLSVSPGMAGMTYSF